MQNVIFPYLWYIYAKLAKFINHVSLKKKSKTLKIEYSLLNYMQHWSYLKGYKGSYNIQQKDMETESHNTNNRASMFAFQWKEFSPPLSSAHRLLT